MFNLTHRWNFPSNNYGQIFGIADSGVETFKGTPIKSLAREICQNSIDANLHNGLPTRIEFKLFEIPVKDIPDFGGLEDALRRSLDFWSQQESDKAKSFFNSALNTAHQKSIRCLRISDFNTTGLTGSREVYNSPWCNLTKSTGASDKSGSNGGSFGIGKFAPYACSTFRTVFYSTADMNGICAYQGVSRLTSFELKKGEIAQGTGFYGNEKNTPVYEQFSLDPNYKRDPIKPGTDIFIVGFNGDDDWQSQMVASILDGFLYAVYVGNLEVDVNGIIISQSTLKDLVISYKSHFREHADEYYQTLTDEKLSRVFERELTNDPETAGKLTLHLMIMPDYHRRVAMVRQTGMKIKDKGNISGLIPFAGLLYIEGDSLNTFLRTLENPQHLEWEIDRAETKKAKARQLISGLTKFIKECLNEMKNDDSEEALDPSVGEYLSAPQEEDQRNQDRAENIQDAIHAINVKVTETSPKPTGTQSGDDGKTEVDDDNGDIVTVDLPGVDGSGSSGGSNGGGGNGGGHNPGAGGGDTPVEHRKTFSSIAPASIRSFINSKDTGEYTINFTPSASAADGYLDIFMAAESQSYEATIISADCPDFPQLTVDKNRIWGLTFEAKKQIKIHIQLDYHDFCPLEVKAYGNKG